MGDDHLFFASFKPVYYISKILGLSPWSVCSENGRTKFKSTTPGIVYTSLIFVVFFVWQIYIINWRVNNDYKGASLSYIVPQLLSICSSFITAVSSLLMTITVGRKSVEKIVQSILVVDEALLLNNAETSRKYKSIAWLEVVLFVAVTGLLYGYDLWVWFGKKGDNYVVNRGLVYAVNALTVLQYIDFIYLLKHRFQVLIRQLHTTIAVEMDVSFREIIRKTDKIPSETKSLETAGVFKIRDEIFPGSTPGLQPTSHLFTRRSKLDKKVAKIHKYREIYSILYDISHLVNSAFGIQNLLQFITIFIVIVKGLHFLLTTLDDPTVVKVSHEVQFHAAMLVLLWAGFHAIQLLWISIVCHQSCAIGNSTGYVVQKLLLKELTEESRTELMNFSNQLVHSKLTFTAIGFFTVDLNVLCAISGAIMTYTIILNQAQ